MKPVSLVFFRNHGVDSLQRDSKGGTPLHWAAYYGCEQATNYLLSFKEIAINSQDLDGLTPLHLAVLSGNSRVVKRLLVKGSDKKIKDRKL
jgi:palmitoyltransferase